MRVWASANQKGGVGKTTTVVSLAGWLSLQGKRVLLVDLDPHGSLSAYFGFDPDTQQPSLYHLFQQPPTAVAKIIVDTRFENIKLIPASTAVATLDRQLGNQEGKGLVLRNALVTCFDRFDYCLIDCPPILGVLMVNALAAAEHLLVPVQSEFLAIKGLERMVRTLQMIMKSRKQALAYTVVATMFDRRTRAAHESLQLLREQYPEILWQGVIPLDTQFRDASRQGLPIPCFLPASRGAQAYLALLQHLTAEVQPQTPSQPKVLSS
ncbi:MAG: ParA family protein [Gammaproteobacteria bacterium]|nr:ParA family protein [Gammaproteobacteria bacterium]